MADKKVQHIFFCLSGWLKVCVCVWPLVYSKIKIEFHFGFFLAGERKIEIDLV